MIDLVSAGQEFWIHYFFTKRTLFFFAGDNFIHCPEIGTEAPVLPSFYQSACLYRNYFSRWIAGKRKNIL